MTEFQHWENFASHFGNLTQQFYVLLPFCVLNDVEKHILRCRRLLKGKREKKGKEMINKCPRPSAVAFCILEKFNVSEKGSKKIAL